METTPVLPEVFEQKDKHRIRVTDLLKAHPEGLTIADVMKYTGLSRHTVLARLHHLVGSGKVVVRTINMAKVHYWNEPSPAPNFTTPDSMPSTIDHIQLQPITREHLKRDLDKPVKAPAKELESAQTTPRAQTMQRIKQEIEKKLAGGEIKKTEAQIAHQRLPISTIVDAAKHLKKAKSTAYIMTGIAGFDELLEQGIPKGSSILVAGGAGSGKTLFSLQIAANQARQGKKCLYMSFEESDERLINHMNDFGWHPEELIKKGTLIIKRFNPFDITRNVDALLMKLKGELLIDIEPIIFPENFKPDIVILDSLTAIASAFTGKEESYRMYIEQLFRFFEKIGAVSFLISETKEMPTIFSSAGVEEFLADGVIVLYHTKHGNVRENGIEILKLRGAKHQKKIVALQITDKGIVVYPEQELFGMLETDE